MNKLTVRLLAASALCAVSTVALTIPAVARESGVTFSISLGDAVFGYDDGYYDNDRRWHDWRNDEERDWYRENHRQTYYQMGRYDDRDDYRREWLSGRRNDWRDDRQDDVSISLGNVVFAYDDGYYDNGRRWHDWRSDRERDWYRRNHGQTYYQMGRYDDRDTYRRDWLGGRRDDWRDGGSDVNFTVLFGNVVFAYDDGYYDNSRRWHNWNNVNERNWYMRNHGQTYYHMRHYRDRDHNRRDWRDGRRDDWRS